MVAKASTLTLVLSESPIIHQINLLWIKIICPSRPLGNKAMRTILLTKRSISMMLTVCGGKIDAKLCSVL